MATESLPTLSVLIHNRNRADCLARCLESICRQDIRPLEVVILDAQSTDNSEEVLKEHLAKLEASGITVHMESCAPAGVPASRNLAASRASGDLLFFMDNDAALDDPTALTWLREYFHQNQDVGLTGLQILAGDRNELDPFCWVYRRGTETWRDRAFDTFTFAGAGFCARGTPYHACGGFWEVIDYAREEEALALRMIDRGWRVSYRPEIAVRHYPDPRGRRELIERRAVELKNGALIYWHAYPAGFGLVMSLLRAASMSCRAVLRREGSPATLLRGWMAGRRIWRDLDLQRDPVSWRTILELAKLHRSTGANDVTSS
jgi:glycosyltransferase involved in cell wall biosynthesis